MNKTSDFPYPVLRNDKKILTGYNKEYYLNIECDDPINIEKDYLFKIKVTTNSNTIDTLIKENTASVYISYQTEILKKTSKIENNDLTFDLRIPYTIFKSVDELVISAVVIANSDFDLVYNEEMDEGYRLDVPYFVTKKDIIAISNEIIFDFNKSGKTIIKLVKQSDLSTSFQVNINQDDFILIEVNPDFKKSYDKIATSESELDLPVLTLIHASLINMALINVFMRLVNDGYDQHKNKRWFKVIRSTLNAKDINFEEKLDELRNDMDINELYKLVNNFLNNFFEKAINKYSEALK